MAGYSAENIKHWITPQGVMYGTNVAFLFDMKHIEFHDKLFNYFRTHAQDEPVMYWKDPNSENRIPFNAEFPNNMVVAINNYSDPTYGIESKHIDDLYAVFAGKGDIINVIKQAFDLN